jgi:mRNA interferase HigB
VQIATRKHLAEAMASYKDAADELKKWRRIVSAVRWRTFEELRSVFNTADNVGGYVIFDIRHNRYRLVTVVHYAKVIKEKQTKGHVYIRSFLTHKEYDNPTNWNRKHGSKYGRKRR